MIYQCMTSNLFWPVSCAGDPRVLLECWCAVGGLGPACGFSVAAGPDVPALVLGVQCGTQTGRGRCGEWRTGTGELVTICTGYSTYSNAFLLFTDLTCLFSLVPVSEG